MSIKDDVCEFSIVKIGNLRYDRITALSTLKRELKMFGYEYTISEIKTLFDTLYSGRFDKPLNRATKYCIDCIFNDTEYMNILDITEDESNFPKNWIPPIG